jgi:hypothetical protein
MIFIFFYKNTNLNAICLWKLLSCNLVDTTQHRHRTFWVEHKMKLHYVHISVWQMVVKSCLKVDGYKIELKLLWRDIYLSSD